MLWRILRIAVVSVVEGEPVRCGNHLTISILILTPHLSEILVLHYTEIPAVTVPTLELWQIVNAIRGGFFVTQFVQGNSGPLRT